MEKKIARVGAFEKIKTDSMNYKFKPIMETKFKVKQVELKEPSKRGGAHVLRVVFHSDEDRNTFHDLAKKKLHLDEKSILQHDGTKEKAIVMSYKGPRGLHTRVLQLLEHGRVIR